MSRESPPIRVLYQTAVQPLAIDEMITDEHPLAAVIWTVCRLHFADAHRCDHDAACGIVAAAVAALTLMRKRRSVACSL